MNCEKNLLQALVLFVSLNPGYTETQKNLGTVYDLLVTNSDDQLEAIFSALSDTHPAKLPYLLYKKVKNNGNVAGGIAQGLGGRLQVFQADSIRDITSAVEIDLELPAKEKCAYFVTLSDQDSTYEFLSSLFFSFLFIDIARWADRYGGGICKQPVNFILDEFPNIGEIPDFERKLATIRSRHMNISIIFQNIAQLKNRYPYDVWTSILGDCDTQLFLGCTDELTAKHISDRSGIIGVEVESSQRELQSVRLTDYTPQYKATSGQGKRNLMNVDEVMRLPNRQEIVFLRSQKGLKLDKFDYSRHPDARKLKPCSVSDHIPAWRAARMAHAARGAASPAPASVPVPASAGTAPVSGNSASQPQSAQPAPASAPTSQNTAAPAHANTRQRPRKPKSAKPQPAGAPKPTSQNSEMPGQQSLLDGSLDGMFTEKSPKDV